MRTYKSYLMFAAVIFTIACNKKDFLDARPDQSLVVPSTLEDLQAILDNDYAMNGFGTSGFPVLGAAGADDYYVRDEIYNSYFKPLYKNAAIWNKEIYSGETILDWDLPYRCVFYANVVLDGLSNIQKTSSNTAQWNNEMGSALVYRANAFFQLSQVFAPVYDSTIAGTSWGLPLRLHADVNEMISRATLAETYNQITNDLLIAVLLLPDKQDYPTRPSKAAAYGLLARMYLSMRDYNKALMYADSCLELQHSLMDYNTISTTAFFPFKRFNSEVVFTYMQQEVELNPVAPGSSYVDSILYSLYEENDLRKLIFFKKLGTAFCFCGTYDERGYMFGGIATDEMLLTRAECEARENNVVDALNDLNTLLEKRYVTGTFKAITVTNAADALMIILTERRKELVMRGLRWTDLRRLNKESAFAKTIYRTVNGIVYSLSPNDKRYVYPIPGYVISFNPGMSQNER